MALFHAHCHLHNDPIAFDGDNSQVFFDDCNEYLVVYKLGVFTVTSVQARRIPPQVCVARRSRQGGGECSR